MKVSKGQHVATLRIGHNEELSAVHFLGGLEELGISLTDETLVGLSEDKKDSFEALLDDFKDIFAMSNEDLGCAEG
ncbi:hypothetical protein DSO57_1007159 [Entomophthora muscae]|uniref:Uncharacterized protein n=1 Tax=Entomophthora muscae TaxID=34485 RepID=A0ACC2U538_9FUNG|nr:hypothetical protein DSO57_1007159 [Entomophthora muscae]